MNDPNDPWQRWLDATRMPGAIIAGIAAGGIYDVLIEGLRHLIA